MRTVVAIVLMLLGLAIAGYSAVGSLFVSAAVGKAGENVGWGTVVVLIVIAAFGVAVFALGITMVVAKWPATRAEKAASVRP